MTAADLPVSASGGAGSDDPVAAAREWLLRNGGVVPPEPEEPGSRQPGSRQLGAAPGALTTSSAAAPAEDRTRQTADDEELGSAPRALPGRRERRAAGRGHQQEDVDADPETVARTVVLRKLAAQARTRHELAAALEAREVPAAVASAVLDRMESVGLVDDAAFARDWVASRQQRRHLSRSALRRELQRKGVERELVEEAVSEVDGGDELRAARNLADRKLRSMSGLPREVRYRRLAGALARRGFGSGVTATVLEAALRTDADTDVDV